MGKNQNCHGSSDFAEILVMIAMGVKYNCTTFE